jgi:hypothetical protein
MTKSEAGRLGGLATLKNHGKAYFKSTGALGGRPRRLTINELRAKGQIKAGGRLQAGFESIIKKLLEEVHAADHLTDN